MKFPNNFEESSKRWKELIETVGLEKIEETLSKSPIKYKEEMHTEREPSRICYNCKYFGYNENEPYNDWFADEYCLREEPFVKKEWFDDACEHYELKEVKNAGSITFEGGTLK